MTAHPDAEGVPRDQGPPALAPGLWVLPPVARAMEQGVSLPAHDAVFGRVLKPYATRRPQNGHSGAGELD